MNFFLKYGARFFRFIPLFIIAACSIQVSDPGGSTAVQIATGSLHASATLMDSSGNPLTTIATGTPAQLCVVLTSVPTTEISFAITQQNGKNLTAPTQFSAGQTACITVNYLTVVASRTDNVTVVAYHSDKSPAETLNVVTPVFSVTTPLASTTLSCVAVASPSIVYIQKNSANAIAAGSLSTPVSVTVDCGVDNGAVTISKLPAGFQTTTNGSPTIGTDKKLHLVGTLSAEGTQTLNFTIGNSTRGTSSAKTAVTVNGVGVFSCSLNQAINPLVFTGAASPIETYSVNFANRVPTVISETVKGAPLILAAPLKAAANYSTPDQTSNFTFGGIFSSAGSYAVNVTAQDPIFPGQSISCTTAQATVVQLPAASGPSPITCTVVVKPLSVTIPVDTNNQILGQSTVAAYALELNEVGSVDSIKGPAGSLITPTVATNNLSYTFNASFHAVGTQTITIVVSNSQKTSTATCTPNVSVVPVIQWPPLVCLLTANPHSAVVQMDANNQPVARSNGIKFSVITNRPGANWSGVVGTGNFAAGGLAAVGNGFTFTGSFFAPAGAYAATVTLTDGILPGAPPTTCTTNPTVTIVGRPAMVCSVVPDQTEISIAVNAGNQPLTPTNAIGVTINTYYASKIPTVWGTGGMTIPVAAVASDNSAQHFRTAVNFSAVGQQTITAAVVEPSGASSATCAGQVKVNAFGPEARINTNGLMGPNQFLCSPNFSQTCWNSILSTDGQYRLDMQNDGNLVLYHVADGLPTWATNSAGTGALYATMDAASGYLLLKDAGGTIKWMSGGAVFANATLAVQADANLVIYQSGTARWASATLGWWRTANLWYRNGIMYCTGTPRSPAAAGINACIQNTPTGWTMLLDADTYVIENGAQIFLNKPMTLSTNGGWGSSTPCFNVPVQGDPDSGTHWTGVGCAQLIADTNAHYPWGGFLVMGQPNEKTLIDSQGYAIPQFDLIHDVNVDHINLNGNYIARYAVSTVTTFQSNNEFVNATAVNCTSCSFKNSASQFSVSGGFSMQYNTDNFIADHNSYYWHGNLKETRNGVPAPRHAGCAIVQGQNSQFTNNFIRHCADEAVLISPSVNGLVSGNVFYARDDDYSSTEMRIQADAAQTGLRVIYNAIDCGNAQCTTGITVGADQFEGSMSPAKGYFYSGIGSGGVQIENNIIAGSNIGILVGFRPVAGNAVYISGNAISITGFGQPFQPMACKQWYGSNPNYVCCRPNWFQIPMANWAAPYTNFAMGGGGNPVVGTTIMIDPSDWLQVFKDGSGDLFTSGVDAYAASWKGSGGAQDDSRSCF